MLHFILGLQSISLKEISSQIDLFIVQIIDKRVEGISKFSRLFCYFIPNDHLIDIFIICISSKNICKIYNKFNHFTH